MSHQYVDATFEVKGGIGEFAMSRPDILNALTDELRLDYQAMLAEVEGNDDVGAIIIRGEGRAFSAGGNVKGMQQRKENKVPTYKGRERLLKLHDWLERLYNLDCPVIAAVDGLAYGGGLSMALVSDFVFATPRSTFCSVFGRIGLVPDMGVLYTLPRAVGLPKAKELMFTARSFSGQEAMDMGIVHSLHEPENLLPAARQFAGQLAQGSKAAIAATKRMANRSYQASYREAAEWEADAQAVMSTTEFHREAVRRFMAKEDPLYDWDKMGEN